MSRFSKPAKGGQYQLTDADGTLFFTFEPIKRQKERLEISNALTRIGAKAQRAEAQVRLYAIGGEGAPKEAPGLGLTADDLEDVIDFILSKIKRVEEEGVESFAQPTIDQLRDLLESLDLEQLMGMASAIINRSGLEPEVKNS